MISDLSKTRNRILVMCPRCNDYGRLISQSDGSFAVWCCMRILLTKGGGTIKGMDKLVESLRLGKWRLEGWGW